MKPLAALGQIAMVFFKDPDGNQLALMEERR